MTATTATTAAAAASMTTATAGSASAMLRWCSTCHDEVVFEQPECLENHGRHCPDWVCVECGHAVLVGFLLAPPVTVALTSDVA